MKKGVLIVSLTISILVAGSIWTTEKGSAMRQETDSGIVELPEPVKESAVSVEEALSSRRSTRSFSEKPLTLQDVAQMLWAAQGITDKSGFRTAPSAGALYPLEIYVASGNVEKLPPGLYHYRAESHDLEIIIGGDHRSSLWEAALQQSAVKRAPAVFLFTGVFPRTMNKYGKRGMQYVLIEAGHAAQNLLLQAEAMGLGHVPIGAFDDEVMRKILKIDKHTHPVYMIPVGHK
ncbi:MAG: SagB/ThcOx family dehydrogenase [Desulfosalsimonadaceae bacterium]